VQSKAEDAGGLTPVKDGSAAVASRAAELSSVFWGIAL